MRTAATQTAPSRARRQRATVAAVLAAGCLLLLTAPQGWAQAPADEPPYERQLLRLSEILGALHFLRPLCARPDEPAWRDQMQALLDAEAADEARKRRLVERFNHGYRGFASVYHSCTPAARDALTSYVSEGSALVRDVTSRYSR
ncbi:TIGR02301 family protein [Pannonibacter carbonis]|uniref:TIGR02301 family protein n=1 Tax=Pannonibacter carbonis TaxID=2067569 RepID=UPI000D10FE6B|nr:TIGR02301 family protein [Pannonibacter carbonis]